MDPVTVEWLKKNWHRIVIHCIPPILLFIVVNTVFTGVMDIVFNDTIDLSVETKILLSIHMYGVLIFFTLFLIYMDKWSDYGIHLRKEIKEYKEDKKL